MIAILRAGGLGDVLLTLPALNALHVRVRVLNTGLVGVHRAIEVAGYPAYWQVAAPLVDRILAIDDARFAGLYGDEPAPPARSWLAEHSILVAWTARPLGAWVQDVVPQVIQASPYPPPGVHAATWLVETLAPLGGQLSRHEPEGGWLHLTPMERAWGEGLLGRLGLERPTLIHPGAGAAWKRWPAASFARLALSLCQRGHEVALIEGPADRDAVGAVLAQTGELPVIREADLRALARMLAHARLFIGNDSGVTHLAAMAGAPTVALFGPTDPASWAPLGKVRVLRRCRRTTARQGKVRVCDDPACLAAITVEEVLEVIDIDC